MTKYKSKPRRGLRWRQSQFTYYLGKLITFAYEQGYELTLEDGTITVILCPECGTRVSKHCRASYHHMKLAQDINLFKKGRYQTTTKQHRILGEFWKSLDPGCVWGGDFRKKDGCHYSYTEGKRFD